ncbi:MAG: ribonuclease R [Alphaproteobacteria bacterium]
MANPKKPAPFPTKDQIVEFIRGSTGPVGKREIARAFHIKGDDRVPLKRILKEIKAEGLFEPVAQRRLARPDALPEYVVLEITGTTTDGDVTARPVVWERAAPPPQIFVLADDRDAPGIGDRILGRIAKAPDGNFEARIVRRIAATPDRMVGVYETTPKGGVLNPTNRKQREDVFIHPGDADGAENGELVMVELLPGRPMGPRRARVIRKFGDAGRPGMVSLIAIHSQGIPTEFSREAAAQAEAALPVTPAGRVDLRQVPLITIDGADARDFDDAVHAEFDADPNNPGGWKLLVAIADVAHYVRPNDALDRAAYERGNSVYFPDRVVPMLPEALSNGLCSLKPLEDRACLAAHIWIDRNGNIRRHRFERAIMRSAARLTYDQVQAAVDGQPDETTTPLLEKVLAPLYGAYAVLAEARVARQALEIDLPERKVELGPDGRVQRIAPIVRHDSHKLIEEFMIAANVAAAETLEKRRQPCMYRVHDVPDAAKLEAVREFLGELGYHLPRGQTILPKNFNFVLKKSAGTPEGRMIHELILRTQNQAVYSPNNLGHFGLALKRYAHFTSPIRRYSDLLVHRALLGPADPDGIGPGTAGDFVAVGEHISKTERRAMAAERESIDRYTTAFMLDRVGAQFTGTVSSVTRFGLFIRLDEIGADGLLPIRDLPGDYYIHDESRHALIGRSTRRTFRLGQLLQVKLVDAKPLTGSLSFVLADEAWDEHTGKPPRQDRRTHIKAMNLRRKHRHRR